jgi:pre-mRNA-splicing factor SPF27
MSVSLVKHVVSLTSSARHTNLTLLQTYGSNTWRVHNYLLESTTKQAEKALEDLKQLTVELNRERKNTQVCCTGNLACVD